MSVQDERQVDGWTGSAKAVLAGGGAALAQLHQRFSRLWASAATAIFKLPVELRLSGMGVGGMEQIGESLVGWPGWRLVLRPERAPGGGESCEARDERAASDDAGAPATASGAFHIGFSGDFAFAMVDRLLGSRDAQPHVPDRAATALERSLLSRAADMTAAVLLEVLGGGRWSLRREAASEAAASSPAEGPMTIMLFSARAACCDGTLMLAVTGPALAAIGSGHQHGQAVDQHRGPLEVVAELEPFDLPADELENLGPGDLLVTDAPAEGAAVAIRVAGVSRYVGTLGQADGKRAVSVKP